MFFSVVLFLMTARSFEISEFPHVVIGCERTVNTVILSVDDDTSFTMPNNSCPGMNETATSISRLVVFNVVDAERPHHVGWQDLFLATVKVAFLPPTVITCVIKNGDENNSPCPTRPWNPNLTSCFHQDDAPAKRPAPPNQAEEDRHSLEDADSQVDDEAKESVLCSHVSRETWSSHAHAQQSTENRSCS